MESTKNIPPVTQTTIDVIKIAAGSDIVPSFEKITPRIYSTPFTALFLILIQPVIRSPLTCKSANVKTY
ncbi:hypothetical protein [Paenibacillus vini]|uniref:hypothetical protein n=1 Tax=Paenibacillus vini TaxID=1476024 RepID=UPI0025B6D97C|nr:hypothetical protein [Paenibacillus vini]